MTSAFFKMLNLSRYRDISDWVFWVDNCSGQNKCWTLYTMLVQHANESNNLRKVTIKYFTAGHNFMSADNFHRNVENELNNDVL